MEMQKKQYVAFCLFLIFCGLVGIVAHFVATPEFVATYLTIDGEIDPDKKQALNRLRVISLATGAVLMGFSVLLLTLSGRSQNPLILRLQQRVDAVFSYDLSAATQGAWNAVSYTHLTLPPNREVEISVVLVSSYHNKS